MKIQIASDLHMELWKQDLPDPARQFASDETRDLLILAGDIVDGNRDHGMPFIQRELGISPVVFVPGNHEYFYAPKREVDAFWRHYAKAHPGFYYLNDDTVQIGGLRFYGAEWCSDFQGDPHHLYYRTMIEDFRLTLGWDTYAHVAEYKAITANIAELAGELDVVITHFPPTLGALDRELYDGNRLNPYFINDNEVLVRAVDARLWVSGHTHSPFDYQVGRTRVIGNPRGYHDNDPRPKFSVMKTVEVGVDPLPFLVPRTVKEN